ncbi:MAG: MmgE/PrpD family protein [Candidatus Obscuribacterales bacterium]
MIGAKTETALEALTDFVIERRFEDINLRDVDLLKIRVLDALGCAIGALDWKPVQLLRHHIDELGGNPRVSLVGGGKTSPDRATLYNSALVRFLDYNDSYLARGETCHPSDNIAAVLACSEYAGVHGVTLLTAIAIAYQIQCRLSDEAPVREHGFDHTTQGAYAAAAGAARALGLNREQTRHAIAISATSNNALRVTRCGRISNWKGLAYPMTAANAVHAAFLASAGISGPYRVMEGTHGFMEAIAGEFTIDWEAEGFDRIEKTVVKKHNAEIHSQSTLEAVLHLVDKHGLKASEINEVEVSTFDVAYRIIGGGLEGDKYLVSTKEEADHSLPYMVAAAILDGQVGPEQYLDERIRSADVQSLMRRVHIVSSPDLSSSFPETMPSRVRITTRSGREYLRDVDDYEGFHTRPMSWPAACEKFDVLASGRMRPALRREIIKLVADLESAPVVRLMALLR